MAVLVSCDDSYEKTEENHTSNSVNSEVFTTPINYDFKKLRLQLNTSIDDTTSNITWKWDYMNSDNGMPDTTGIDHYMNINQPVFSFNGETTLPSLSITTDKKIIKTIFLNYHF